jgi:hypothetical protein
MMRIGLRTVTVQIRDYGRFLRAPVPYRWIFLAMSVRPVIVRLGWDYGRNLTAVYGRRTGSFLLLSQITGGAGDALMVER